MTDITAPLTQDERTVLMIVARGEAMMAIGRWKAAILSLVKRGLMIRHDDFNNVISDAGRAAIEATERAVDEEVKAAFSRAAPALSPSEDIEEQVFETVYRGGVLVSRRQIR